MGKLRKIGRKIKRQVKKLFSSKIGRFLGTIALMYLVPMAANKLFTGFGNLFQGKTWAGAARAGQTVSTVSTAGSTVGAGAGGTVSTAGSTVGAGAGSTGISAGGLDIQLVGSKDLLRPDISSVLGDVAADENFSTKVANFMTDLPSKIKEAPGKAFDYVTGPEFVPELAEGVLTTTATSALMGQPEEPFYSKGIQPYMGEALSTAAKENYIADISSSFRNLTGQTPTSIGQVKNAGFYGPNDPNFFGQLAMIPTIPLPRIT
jgi:hypothetical protein